MRHSQRPTSEQTKRVCKDAVGIIAYEMEYSDDYLYAILSGLKPDPYANFRALFRAVTHAAPGREQIYLSDLSSIAEQAKDARPLQPFEILLNQLWDATVRVQKLYNEKPMCGNAMNLAIDELAMRVQEIRFAIDEKTELCDRAEGAGRSG